MDGSFDRDRALAYLQLCNIAYETDLKQMRCDIANGTGIIDWEPGTWNCAWGPALNKEHGNLAVVAKFVPQNPAHAPTYVITIRGTDITDKAKDWWEDLYQLEEDLSIGSRKPLPRTPSQDILISEGADLGWNSINTLTSNGKTIEAFLLNELAAYENVRPIVAVIGHSLGGCLATVFALTLSIFLRKNEIAADHIPCTFAAPTAGNQGFAEYFAKTFPSAGRFYNTLDVIPRAWADLDAILSIYTHACPWLVEAFVDVMTLEIDRSSNQPYAQPAVLTTGLVGAEMAGSWYAEAAAQHHVATYASLLQKGVGSSE